MLNVLESSSYSFAKNTERDNQDAVLPPKKLSGGVLLAVADGVGSYKGSELASLSAIEYLDQAQLSDSILDYDSTFKLILEKIKELSQYNVEYERASTTLTYCYLDSRGLNIGHIGDCRAYIKVGKKLKQLTRDDTQHQKFLDEKTFTKSQLKRIKGKNIITTAISQVVDMAPSNYFIPIEDLDTDCGVLTLYIMSDGAHSFWEKSPRFSETTMKSVVKMGASLQRRIERKGAIDDYTFVACSIDISKYQPLKDA